jgi:hypothetical protein
MYKSNNMPALAKKKDESAEAAKETTDGRGGLRFGTSVAFDDGIYSGKDEEYVQELVEDDDEDGDAVVDEGRVSSHPSTRNMRMVSVASFAYPMCCSLLKYSCLICRAPFFFSRLDCLTQPLL